MRMFSLALSLTAALSACSTMTQTSSGADYLGRYQPVRSAAQPVIEQRVVNGDVVETRVDTVSTDDLIRHAAAIEPLLQLPARIGLARIEHGRLTSIPEGEGALWLAMAARHAGLGSFAPVDPFLADYTLRTVIPQDSRTLRRDAGDLITKIRLGAARQHMDAVLIYEIGKRRLGIEGFDGLGQISVLGAAPLAAQPIAKEGVARAFLMDVRNGYPYGTASASADLAGLERSFWDDSPQDRHSIAAKTRIAEVLLPQVEAMFGQLTRAMQARLAAAK